VYKVNHWLTIKPPTMVTPSGWRNSLPTPLPSIKGKALSKAHKVVIKIGRKRCKQAW
jgi:hypothetical protein